MAFAHTESDGKDRGWGWLAFVLVACIVLILYFFNPTQYSFYPQCWFYRMTGLDCPGCGTLRAMHQLVHGHVKAAFWLNPLVIGLLPILLLMGLNHAIGLRHGKRPVNITIPFYWPWYLLMIGVAFTILRNLHHFL